MCGTRMFHIQRVGHRVNFVFRKLVAVDEVGIRLKCS